jgi:hypothetical protein
MKKIKLSIGNFFNKMFVEGRVDWAGDRKSDFDIATSGTGIAERKVPTLKDLAENAVLLLEAEEDFYDDPFVPGPEHSEIDILRQVYGHNHCDWFAVALNVVKDWEIVAVGSPGKPSVHRLVRDSEGRLVDVYGYVTVDDLRLRYGIDDLVVFENNDTKSRKDLNEDWIPEFVAAMLYLPYEPFASLRNELMAWVQRMLFRLSF